MPRDIKSESYEKLNRIERKAKKRYIIKKSVEEVNK